VSTRSLTVADTTAKKAAEIPKPPRHAETIKTFEQVAENMAELSKVIALSRHVPYPS
jgi:hypothetical protein